MRLLELVGKEIIDILVTIRPYEEFKEQGLWTADCYIILQDELIVGIPFSLDDGEVWVRELDKSAHSYYQRKWWQRKVSPADDLRNKKISDVISYTESADKAFLELDNGKIITEVTVAPVGISVGLYVYNSVKDMEEKFGLHYIRLKGENSVPQRD